MNCPNCNKPDDGDNNFCSHCGQQLKQDVSEVTQVNQQTIFASGASMQKQSNTELGYLIIALLVLVNVIIWFVWSYVFRSVTSGNSFILYALRFITLALTIGQFVTMFIFSRRQAYRIVITIIGGIIIIYNIFIIIQTFNSLRGF